MTHQQFQEGYRGAGTSGPRRFEPIRPSSPDPVHLVLQYEEDERLARHLQEHGTLSPLDPVEEESGTDDTEGSPRRLQDAFGDVTLDMLSHSCLLDISEQVMSNMERRYAEVDEEDESDEEDTSEDDTNEDDTNEDESTTSTSEVGEDHVDHVVHMEIGQNHNGLDSFEIERLPTRVHRSLSTVQKDPVLDKACQVCLERHANGDKLRILPCFHEFHALCIDPWLMTTSTCPICRVKVDVSGQSTT